jgi:hypothetical protein
MNRLRIAAVAACMASLFALAAAPASQSTLPTTRPGMTVGQIMGAAFRGNAALANKVTAADATDAEKKAFLDIAKAFALIKAPKGDAADWSKRTGAILASAQNLADGKPDAATALKTAISCKTCHDLYK